MPKSDPQNGIGRSFAVRELDVEKVSELETSNSRVLCSESKAGRPFAAVETACKKYRVIILRVEDLNLTLFVKRICVAAERYD